MRIAPIDQTNYSTLKSLTQPLGYRPGLERLRTINNPHHRRVESPTSAHLREELPGLGHAAKPAAHPPELSDDETAAWPHAQQHRADGRTARAPPKQPRLPHQITTHRRDNGLQTPSRRTQSPRPTRRTKKPCSPTKTRPMTVQPTEENLGNTVQPAKR